MSGGASSIRFGGGVGSGADKGEVGADGGVGPGRADGEPVQQRVVLGQALAAVAELSGALPQMQGVVPFQQGAQQEADPVEAAGALAVVLPDAVVEADVGAAPAGHAFQLRPAAQEDRQGEERA